ncbi:MAG: sialidase family protein [Oscillospiraceae bacterium]
MSSLNVKTIFGPNLGGPCENYRIPSMIVTKNNVVIACADARYFTGGDNPNRIDKVIRRSFDSGETWEDIKLIVAEHGTTKMASSAAIDPVMTYIESINRTIVMYCHTPAGIGILNCVCSKGEDDNGNIIVKQGFKKYVLKGNKLFTKSGNETGYTVDKDGDVTKDGNVVGNIYIGKKFMQEKTSTLMMCYSDDDGENWSEPISLNSQIKESYMSFIGPGPGIGIVVREGKYKDRVIVPIYYGTKKFPLCLSCAVIYSDDNGKSWKMGESPNNTRMIGNKKANIMHITNSNMLTESQIIEQEGGRLKYFMRNHDKVRRAATAYSDNGGESFYDFKHVDELPQPICQMSVIKLNNMDKPYVVFVNPSSEKERANGMVRLSEDDGETFKYSRMFKEGTFVYSSIAMLPDGNIGVLYEPNLECKQIDFVKFSLDWIKGDN